MPAHAGEDPPCTHSDGNLALLRPLLPLHRRQHPGGGRRVHSLRHRVLAPNGPPVRARRQVRLASHGQALPPELHSGATLHFLSVRSVPSPLRGDHTCVSLPSHRQSLQCPYYRRVPKHPVPIVLHRGLVCRTAHHLGVAVCVGHPASAQRKVVSPCDGQS